MTRIIHNWCDSHLIYDWRGAHRLRSVQAASAGAVLGAIGAGLVAGFGVYGALQPFWPLLISWVGGTLVCLVVIAARLLRQPPRPHKRYHWNDEDE